MPQKRADPKVKKAKGDSKRRQIRESPRVIADRLTTKLKKEVERRKHIEEALRQSLEINRCLNSSIDSIYIVDRDCRYRFMNARQLSRLGLSFNEVAGKPYGDFHSEEDSSVFAKIVKKVCDTGEPFQIEYRSQRDHKYFLRSFTPVKGSRGKPCVVTVVSKDISELKRSEEKSRALVQERDSLLREIHHRVKNNMQVISSVLNLQTAELDNPEIVAVLKESQRRIHTMALVHEQLYHSTSLEEINFGEYIRSLALQLCQVLRTDSRNIQFQFYLEPLSLNISSAIPCGMIISELISNCLKHAFPGGRAGTITVEFHRKKGSEVKLELIVRDDGVGFPPGIDIGMTGTLGIEVVRILTEQLNGSVELERGQGTTFRVIFEEPVYMPRA